MEPEPRKNKISGMVKQKPLDFWPLREKDPMVLRILKYAVNYTAYSFVLFMTFIVLLVTLLVV